MDGKEMKKILAGFGIAALVSASSMVAANQAHATSCGSKTNGKESSSGKSGCGGSGCSGNKDESMAMDKAGADECPEGMSAEECAKVQEEKAKAAESVPEKGSAESSDQK